MILYGIPTCDTCKKALKALEAAGHAVQFRDIRPAVASRLDDPRRAQQVLGHKNLSTTERHYIRIGKLVDPAE